MRTIEFLDAKHPYTRRFAAAVARDCEDAAVRRVAAKWGLSAQTAGRIEQAGVGCASSAPAAEADEGDEMFWGKGKCLTVVSDLLAGEPIWAGPERKKATLDRFFAEYPPPRRRRSVAVVCVDMWQPFRESLARTCPRHSAARLRHGSLR